MLVQVLKSKIHRVKVTEADLNYIGSITIDPDLLEAANMIEGERVQIVNVNNGERIETYTIAGERGKGGICLNGPAARRVAVGDVIIIIGYGFMEMEAAKNYKPALVFPNTETNKLD
jgi:aspartate 1-decarboxylase